MSAAEQKVLPSRSTRGRRLAEVVGEEAEADADFWNQDAFQEAAEDADFDAGSEPEPADEVDSDFDHNEPADASAAGAGAGAEAPGAASAAERATRRAEKEDARRAAKKRRKYVDPAATRSKATRVAGAAPQRAQREREAPPVDLNVDKTSLRRSTKQASKSSEKVRQQRAAEEEQRRKQREKQLARRPPERKLTQEELLHEASVTEKHNLRDLEQLLKLEEEKKRPAPPRKAHKGPSMRLRSYKGVQTISFTPDAPIPDLYKPQRAPT